MLFQDFVALGVDHVPPVEIFPIAFDVERLFACVVVVLIGLLQFFLGWNGDDVLESAKSAIDDVKAVAGGCHGSFMVLPLFLYFPGGHTSTLASIAENRCAQAEYRYRWRDQRR